MLKWLKHYGGWGILGLGLFIGASLLLRQSAPSPLMVNIGLSALQTLSPPLLGSESLPSSDVLARPSSKLSPLTAPGTPLPQLTSTPSADRPSPPSAVTTLTPEQEEINRRNKAEFEASLPTVDSLIEMRVAIAEGIPTATLRTSSEAIILNRDGTPLQPLAKETSYTVQARGQELQLNGSRLPGAVMIDPAPGLFYLSDRPYRGRLLLIADGDRLWAVNLISMRSYLYSVVGSEVYPHWEMDALKAQAIAARSYALTYYFRPVNEIYHLGATERYQVYSGVEREAETTSQAVDATAGEFVSHRGDIVESLYAASDDIVMEAFAGRGMSQLGAQNLAEQGYAYKQILSHYYPGTGVARIAQDLE